MAELNYDYYTDDRLKELLRGTIYENKIFLLSHIKNQIEPLKIFKMDQRLKQVKQAKQIEDERAGAAGGAPPRAPSASPLRPTKFSLSNMNWFMVVIAIVFMALFGGGYYYGSNTATNSMTFTIYNSTDFMLDSNVCPYYLYPETNCKIMTDAIKILNKVNDTTTYNSLDSSDKKIVDEFLGSIICMADGTTCLQWYQSFWDPKEYEKTYGIFYKAKQIIGSEAYFKKFVNVTKDKCGIDLTKKDFTNRIFPSGCTDEIKKELKLFVTTKLQTSTVDSKETTDIDRYMALKQELIPTVVGTKSNIESNNPLTYSTLDSWISANKIETTLKQEFENLNMEAHIIAFKEQSSTAAPAPTTKPEDGNAADVKKLCFKIIEDMCNILDYFLTTKIKLSPPSTLTIEEIEDGRRKRRKSVVKKPKSKVTKKSKRKSLKRKSKSKSRKKPRKSIRRDRKK